MEALVEVVIQIFGELLLQIIFEVLVEIGMHGLSDSMKKPRHPIVSAIGYVILGLAAGGLSLLIFPASFITDPTLRMVNLIATPVAAGLLMMLVGRLRDRKGQDLVRLDRFGYAFVFAFSMAGVRYIAT